MAFLQTNTLWVQQLADHVAVIVLDPPGKVNYLDDVVLGDLERALGAIEADPRFQVAVLRSNKASSFCHGTDPLFWGKLDGPEAFREYARRGQRVGALLTNLRVPTAALIGGACLGSGLELALACDWRIAIDRPATTLGFSELEIGLIPSFGGIGRALDLVGLERTLQLVLGGRKLSAAEASARGLVDDVVRDGAEEPCALPTEAGKRTPAHRPRRTWRQRCVEPWGWGRRLIFRGAERVLRARLPDEMPAPWEALGLVRAHLEAPQAAAALAEEALVRLAASPAFRNLSRLHWLREERRQAQESATAPRQLAVLGSSPLALQLVLQTVARGRSVVLREKDEMTLGVTVLHLVRLLQEEVRRGNLATGDYTQHVNLVRPTVSWKNFEGVDVVVDATPGDVAAKEKLFREVQEHCGPDTLLAATSAAIPLARLQAVVQRPERVAGLRFPPPVGRAAVVEVQTSPATNDATRDGLVGWAAGYNKVAVLMRETPGGLIQRVWAPGLYEAVRLVEAGILPQRIEEALRRFGMVQGPLEQLDQMGLDEFVHLAEAMQPAWPNEVRANPLLQAMIGRRWLGAKSGGGFYVQRRGAKRLRRRLPITGDIKLRAMSVAEQLDYVRERVVGAMVDEAERCLSEGIAASAEDLDLALALTGWAPHRGGPLRYLASRGA